MQTTNQTWLCWNLGTWKASYSSKFVDFPLIFFILYLAFLQVYKAIFTSPSSAKDVLDEENDAENMPPTKSRKTSSNYVRRHVASKLHLNDKVTPRSIAYAAVQVRVFILYVTMLIHNCQLHFNLQTADSWSPIYNGFDYRELYNYVVDVFEDTPGPAAKKRAQDLLNWWSAWVFPLLTKNIKLNSDHGRKIFPAAALHRQSNTSASRKAFKEQRAALEREWATWAALMFWWLSYIFVYTYHPCLPYFQVVSISKPQFTVFQVHPSLQYLSQ